MDLKDKIVLAHKGYFNKDCQRVYQENSKELCYVTTSKDYINTIELDIRKSKDGILYCYHGSFLEYFFFLKFPKDFSYLQKKFKVNSLKEILEVIGEDKAILLDIKDHSITKEDIAEVIGSKKFREVIIANKSPSLLRRFDGMSVKFVKMLNGNIFCKFYNIDKLKKENFKYFEVQFPFQVSKRIIKKVGDKMDFGCAGIFFLNKKTYWNKINKSKINHVYSDFI